jgi:hypothetical protein
MTYRGKRHHMFVRPGVGRPGLLLECAARDLTQRYG